MPSATPVNRDTFVVALHEGLNDLPEEVIADLVRDYEAHIEEGVRRGRPEAEIVDALGDPVRLARELRAEVRVKQWRDTRSPSAAVGALISLLGLGTIGLFAFAPLVVVAAGILVALFVTAVGVFCAGAVLMVSPWLGTVVGGPLGEQLQLFVTQSGESAVALVGFSLISGSVAASAAIILIAIGVVHACVWYGRLHYKLLRPQLHRTLEPQPTKLTVIGT